MSDVDEARERLRTCLAEWIRIDPCDDGQECPDHAYRLDLAIVLEEKAGPFSSLTEEKARADARRAALEEAARVAEKYDSPDGKWIAAKILDLVWKEERRG
jgi:hypothetical protein